MKRIIYSSTIVVVILSVIMACSESFLERQPQGALDLNILSNQAGVEANLISAYSVLDGYFNQGGDTWPTAGSNWIFSDLASDDSYKGSQPGDQPIMEEIEQYNWSPISPYFSQKFIAVYEGVARSNATLSLLATVDEVSDADRASISGQARFLRAHYHFDAYKMWENIPYYTEEDVDFNKANDVDVIPLIIADLEYAIDNVSPTRAGTDAGRVTRATAQAYLGKVLLYNGQHAEALAQFNQVLGNGEYSLNPCFHDVFNNANDGDNPESLLAIQASINDGSVDGENSNYPDRLAFPHAGSPFGCCGFHQPTQNLVNAFKVDGAGLPVGDDVDYVPASDVVDPRLSWTVGIDDMPYLDWGVHDPTWIRDRPYAGPFSPKKKVYHQAQGSHSAGGWNGASLGANNFHLLRLADVILMAAECEINAGNLTAATDLVNQLRERAGNCAQGTGGSYDADDVFTGDESQIIVPIDDASITWASYDVGLYPTFSSADQAMDAVMLERRLELAQEGHRLFDLRRWGIAAQVLNAYIATEQLKRPYLSNAATFTTKHNLYPLPTLQLELSRKDGVPQLIQNSEW